jgi:hypothetical protein
MASIADRHGLVAASPERNHGVIREYMWMLA